MAEALSKSGRNIVLGICEWGQRNCEEWCEEVGGSLWRTSYDVRDMWKDIVKQGGMGILDIVNVTAPLAKDVRHGQWPDMDMLVVGLNGKGGPSSDLGGVGCNYTEYQTQMSMWCMMSSVLALSNDLRQLSPEDKRILLNKEMIAIDQDPLGKAAERKVNEKDYQIFVRPLADGSHAVAILNSSDKPIQVLADFKQLGLNGKYLAASRYCEEGKPMEGQGDCPRNQGFRVEIKQKEGVPFRMTHPQHLYLSFCYLKENYFLLIARSIATAIATVAPTIGLLPIPITPIISTCAGTEELPANCASECILPIVSVIP